MSKGPTFWKTVWVADWYSFSFCSRSSLFASACSSEVFTFRRPCYRERQKAGWKGAGSFAGAGPPNPH